MDSFSDDVETTPSYFKALDRYENLSEKGRKPTEDLEAAWQAAIETADKWESANQPRWDSLLCLQEMDYMNFYVFAHLVAMAMFCGEYWFRYSC
jgi:hypothetical protein